MQQESEGFEFKGNPSQPKALMSLERVALNLIFFPSVRSEIMSICGPQIHNKETSALKVGRESVWH